MNLTPLITIVLFAFAHGGGSRGRSAHGKEKRKHGGANVHDEKMNAQKRMVFKKGDYLFNNLAKALTDMIKDAFTETLLINFCKIDTSSPEASLIITDMNKDVTDEGFPIMASNYKEYQDDALLTKMRDGLAIYDDQVHTEANENALGWGKTIEELRDMVYSLIDKAIETTWLEKDKKDDQKNKLNGLFSKITNRINQVVDDKEYVDQNAKVFFISDKKNENQVHLVDAVEDRIEEVLRDLPRRIQQWSLEAANFYKKKLKTRKLHTMKDMSSSETNTTDTSHTIDDKN